MNKKGNWLIWIVLVLSILLVGILIFYFVFFLSNNEKVYDEKEVKNPVENLTDQQAATNFNESFIYYLLYELKAYNLHNPPFSSDVPKIEIKVGDDIYNSLIVAGEIKVAKGEINSKDVIIVINKDEAVKMLRNKSYVMQSFNEEKSGVELVASQTTLFAKGYLKFYNQIVGKSTS